MKNKVLKYGILLAALALIGGYCAYWFWPRPLMGADQTYTLHSVEMWDGAQLRDVTEQVGEEALRTLLERHTCLPLGKGTLSGWSMEGTPVCVRFWSPGSIWEMNIGPNGGGVGDGRGNRWQVRNGQKLWNELEALLPEID